MMTGINNEKNLVRKLKVGGANIFDSLYTMNKAIRDNVLGKTSELRKGSVIWGGAFFNRFFVNCKELR